MEKETELLELQPMCNYLERNRQSLLSKLRRGFITPGNTKGICRWFEGKGCPLQSEERHYLVQFFMATLKSYLDTAGIRVAQPAMPHDPDFELDAWKPRHDCYPLLTVAMVEPAEENFFGRG